MEHVVRVVLPLHLPQTRQVRSVVGLLPIGQGGVDVVLVRTLRHGLEDIGADPGARRHAAARALCGGGELAYVIEYWAHETAFRWTNAVSLAPT